MLAELSPDNLMSKNCRGQSGHSRGLCRASCVAARVEHCRGLAGTKTQAKVVRETRQHSEKLAVAVDRVPWFESHVLLLTKLFFVRTSPSVAFCHSASQRPADTTSPGRRSMCTTAPIRKLGSNYADVVVKTTVLQLYVSTFRFGLEFGPGSVEHWAGRPTMSRSWAQQSKHCWRQPSRAGNDNAHAVPVTG